MGGEKYGARLPQLISSLLLLFVYLCLTTPVAAKSDRDHSDSSPSLSKWNFRPIDSHLLDTGSPQPTKLVDGRSFKSDSQAATIVDCNHELAISAPSIPNNSLGIASVATPLFLTAKLFFAKATFSFSITSPGRHWLRLYFYPIPHPEYNLTEAIFTVQTNKFILLHDFQVPDSNALVFKEYLINIPQEEASNTFSVTINPKQNGFAFLNAIELVSAPDTLISDNATVAFPVGGQFSGLSNYALEVVHRLNVGGPLIAPINDTLSRTWLPDNGFWT
ncbi:hypothetical protein IFM89_003099 [Coptis chinensis]|uniref:Malectin-like domain-containing protein n=1 Tax=Coptis chinensis TaxID=261450 RepID=A0A835M8E0_9MAGN|nr:hypothetical protein IFM89_003099 [Coptis chinensis]